MTPTEPREAQPLLDDVGVVAIDVQCLRCGYNLRGLRGDGLCPECAAPVGRSTQGDFLRFADPGWVRRLARGSRLVVAGITTVVIAVIVAVVGFFGAAMLNASGGGMSGGGFGAAVAIGLVLAVLAWLASMACLYGGAWLLTSPDPRQIGRDAQVTSRKLVRLWLLVGLAGAPLGWLVDASRLPPAGTIAVLAIQTALGVVALVGSVAYFFYLARLCERIPDRDLHRTARGLGIMVGWLQGVFLAIGAITIVSFVTSGSTPPAAPSPLSAASAPTSAAATPPRPAPPLGSPLAATMMVVGCVSAVAGIIWIVWAFRALRLQLKLRKVFIEQAAMAEASWASSAPHSQA